MRKLKLYLLGLYYFKFRPKFIMFWCKEYSNAVIHYRKRLDQLIDEVKTDTIRSIDKKILDKMSFAMCAIDYATKKRNKLERIMLKDMNRMEWLLTEYEINKN